MLSRSAAATAARTEVTVSPGYPAKRWLVLFLLFVSIAINLLDRQVLSVLAPVIPEPAPPYTEVKAGGVDEIVRRMGRFSRLTRPFNGLGLPAIALPCGVGLDGLPRALQLVGRPFDEATLLALGHALEAAHGVPSAPVE